MTRSFRFGFAASFLALAPLAGEEVNLLALGEGTSVVVEPARDSPARELAIRCIVPTEAYREAAARADPCELRESIQPE